MAMATGKTDGPGKCQGFQRVQAFHFPALELAAANSDTPTDPVTMGSREAAGGTGAGAQLHTLPTKRRQGSHAGVDRSPSN